MLGKGGVYRGFKTRLQATVSHLPAPSFSKWGPVAHRISPEICPAPAPVLPAMHCSLCCCVLHSTLVPVACGGCVLISGAMAGVQLGTLLSYLETPQADQVLRSANPPLSNADVLTIEGIPALLTSTVANISALAAAADRDQIYPLWVRAKTLICCDLVSIVHVLWLAWTIGGRTLCACLCHAHVGWGPLSSAEQQQVPQVWLRLCPSEHVCWAPCFALCAAGCAGASKRVWVSV